MEAALTGPATGYPRLDERGVLAIYHAKVDEHLGTSPTNSFTDLEVIVRTAAVEGDSAKMPDHTFNKPWMLEDVRKILSGEGTRLESVPCDGT